MSKLNMFNQIKSLAFGLDGLFKSTGQTNVKFHQVTAAVFLAIYEKMEAHDLDALREIFGDAINNSAELESMRIFLADVVTGIKAAKDDRALNDVMNNYRYVDQPGRFPSYITDEPARSQFKGRLVINHSYQKKEILEPGDTVNVVLTIDGTDATQLVRVVLKQLEDLGLVVGRLTSTTDTAERHVSFGLRMQYTDELGVLVRHLNETVLPTLTLETVAKLQVVTPMDIRTSRSAISLLSDETCAVLQELQKQIYQATGDTGNQLPRLHITHGNSPIQAGSVSDIAKLRNFAPTVDTALSGYGLDLAAALEKKREQSVTAIPSSMWTTPTSDQPKNTVDATISRECK